MNLIITIQFTDGREVVVFETADPDAVRVMDAGWLRVTLPKKEVWYPPHAVASVQAAL